MRNRKPLPNNSQNSRIFVVIPFSEDDISFSLECKQLNQTYPHMRAPPSAPYRCSESGKRAQNGVEREREERERERDRERGERGERERDMISRSYLSRRLSLLSLSISLSSSLSLSLSLSTPLDSPLLSPLLFPYHFSTAGKVSNLIHKVTAKFREGLLGANVAYYRHYVGLFEY